MSKDNYSDHLYALIVAGGGGTRLWPKSRNIRPKQFLPLFGKQTLIQITARRFSSFVPWPKIFVVTTTPAYKKEIQKEVPMIPSENIIVEPFRRNTAPAHGLGAMVIFKKDPQAVILNESADHLIDPEKNYIKTMKAAAQAAFAGDWLVAVGIKPSYPNIGYGYIKRGDKNSVIKGKTIYKLDRFTEKPELKVAKKYLSTGLYYWNANQYVWRADSILKALGKHVPKIAASLQKIGDSYRSAGFDVTLKKEYEKMPDISIDYAVSERAKNFLLLVADYHWTDIGDWKEVWENLPKDENNNVIIDGEEPGGRVINIDTSDALIQTDGRLIAVVDVDNVAIIDTKEILLVCAKSRAQNVKKIVEQLKEEKETEYL